MCAMRRAPAREQMLDREPTARVVVGREREVARIVRRGVGVDDGHRDVLAERGPRVGLPPDDDDAVDPAAEQRLQVVLLADRVPAGVAEEDVDLAGAEGVLGAHQDRDHEAALEVAGEQSDRSGAAGEQAARHARSGVNESCSAAASTRCARRGATSPRPLSALEAVAIDTPARRATSLSVAARAALSLPRLHPPRRCSTASLSNVIAARLDVPAIATIPSRKGFRQFRDAQSLHSRRAADGSSAGVAAAR